MKKKRLYDFLFFLPLILVFICCSNNFVEVADEEIPVSLSRSYDGDLNNLLDSLIDWSGSNMTVSQKNMLLNELFYLCSGSYLLKKMLDTLPRPLTKIIFVLRPTAVEYAGFAPNPFGPHEIFFAGDYQITNVNILHEFVHYLLFELYPNFSSTHSSDVEEYQVKVLVDLLLCRSYGKVVCIQGAVEGDVLTPRYKNWIYDLAMYGGSYEEFEQLFIIYGGCFMLHSHDPNDRDDTFHWSKGIESTPYFFKDYWKIITTILI